MKFEKTKVAAFLIVMGALSTSSMAADSIHVGDQFQSDGAEVDISQIQSCDGASSQALNRSRMSDEFVAPEMSCQTQEAVVDKFDTASVILSAGSAITACTAAGAPASVVLSLGAAVSATLEMVVKHMSCDDSATQAQIEAQTKATVCDVLAKQGITCISN